jgi:outer membrane protein assembly factor BamA
VLLFLFIKPCITQNYTLTLTDGNEKETKKFPDSIRMFKYLDNKITEYILVGYPDLKYELERPSEKSFTCKIVKGRKYKYVYLKNTEYKELKKKSNQTKGTTPDKKIEAELNEYANQGYPFVRAEFVEIRKQNDTVIFFIHLNPGPKVLFDSVNNKGNVILKNRVFYRITGIQSGDLFSLKSIPESEKKINASGFMLSAQPPKISYYRGKMNVEYYTQRMNASRFDGIIGLQPDPINNKSVLTGNVLLHLKNSLINHAEDIKLEWRRVRQETQEILLFGKIPYVFGTIAGCDAKFNLYRQDTSILDVQWEGALHFFFSGLNSVRLFSARRTSSGKSNFAFGSSGGESNITTGGIGIQIEKTNFPLNPIRGFNLHFNASIGNRVIKTKNTFTDTEVNKKYEYYDGKGNFQFFLPLSQRSCLLNGFRWAGAFSSSPLLPSELFRSGGLQSWRGFDENQFLSSFYAVQTLEYRFLFSTLSHIAVFTDGGWFERLLANDYISSFAFGYGAGLQLETKGGIIKLAYALGHLQGQTPDIRAGKIHVGFVSVFK